jgi:hypothetical protein
MLVFPAHFCASCLEHVAVHPEDHSMPTYRGICVCLLVCLFVFNSLSLCFMILIVLKTVGQYLEGSLQFGLL